jgi:hypothetical protein
MGYILPTNQTLYFPSRNETNKAGKHNREKNQSNEQLHIKQNQT